MTCRIRFTQSGGLGGLTRQCALDGDALEPSARRALEDSLALSPLILESSAGRDLIRYDITVEKDRKSYQFSFNDLTVPEPLRPLLSSLMARSRP